MRIAITCTLALLCGVGTARAERRNSHFDMNFAFITGARSYEQAVFAYDEGNANPAISSVFRSQPFTGVGVAGPSGEIGLVINNLRLNVGWAYPYARLGSSQQWAALGGGSTMEVRALELSEMRYGVGYEYSARNRTAIFADLIGTTDKVTAKVVVGDAQSSYVSRNFGFSARVGVRVPVAKQYYAHASGEMGLGGNLDYGAQFGVGLRLP